MAKFNDWFTSNLEVGAFPFTVNERFEPSKYDYIINVSDEYYPKVSLKLKEYTNLQYFWFPMNEAKKDIGLNSIYGAMTILFEAEKSNKKVYLHCHAGVNRSQLVMCCYHYLRTGKYCEPRVKRNGYVNQLYASCHRGYLPPISEMEKFLSLHGKYLNGTLQESEMMGGMLDVIKIETINNF
jgi:hypothetical protein